MRGAVSTPHSPTTGADGREAPSPVSSPSSSFDSRAAGETSSILLSPHPKDSAEQLPVSHSFQLHQFKH